MLVIGAVYQPQMRKGCEVKIYQDSKGYLSKYDMSEINVNNRNAFKNEQPVITICHYLLFTKYPPKLVDTITL